MDFVANGSKNVEIETSTGVYLRHAIQTHFVEIGEDYIELVNRYVKPLYEEGDLLSISEKIIALCQKRVVYRKDMKISWLAKFLSRFAIQHNSAGIGVGEVCKMQFAINECGAWKVLWAAICAGFGKLVYTAFATIGGNAVGIVATGETLCHNCVAKASRFVRLCDAFSVPVITIVDTEGFVPSATDGIAGGIREADRVAAAYDDASTAGEGVRAGAAVGPAAMT